MSLPAAADTTEPERPTQASSALSSAEIFAIARDREVSLSRLLMAYISTGLVFMLLPGTFLGVWNLLRISGRESAASISAAWLQAHGHAQIFGWIGSFIFGIGFYSVPKLRGAAKPVFRAAWACWAMWTLGVALRWFANVYAWQWRMLLPTSAILELVAFLIFFRTVSQHRPGAASPTASPAANSDKPRFKPWIWMVISASLGLLLGLAANLVACIYVSLRGGSPAFPHTLDQRYLVLLAWGFLVPFVWGFSAKWMSVFLGLKPTRPKLLFGAISANACGIVLALLGWTPVASGFLVLGAVLAIIGLRMFESSQQEPKTRGVHASFPIFVRMAYGWLLLAALIGVAAARWDTSGGIWGASRHALTVGFIALMVFCVGQRILPAFAGMRLLWSTRLMFAGVLMLTIGCALRVSCEILAYQEYAAWAWSVLPLSALLELAAVTAFATNIFGTFILEPSHVCKEPLVVRIL